MPVWTRTLLAVALVTSVPLLVTLLISSRERFVRAWLPNLLSFGIGVLIASASLHLIPEAVTHSTATKVVLITFLGFVSFAGLERMLASHDHGHVHGMAMGVPHSEHTHGDSSGRQSRATLSMAFGADALHNFVDGILIAATFMVRPELGMMTALAIGLHELPRELGTFSLFVHGGLSPRKAVAFNAITAVFALSGAVLALLIGPRAEHLAMAILPFAAGSMLYIASSVARSVLPPINGVIPFRRMGWVAAGGCIAAFLLVQH